jgi:branched-chain amino acid transport system permease protein
MSLPSGNFQEKYAQDMGIVRTKTQWVLLALFLILMFVFPKLPFSSDRLLTIITFMGITIIAVHGLNILTGYCGQVSLGHAGFMAAGAYISAILVTKLGWSFWAAMPCAALGAGFIGLIFGVPSLRLKGFYLIMTTVAAYFIIIWVILQFRSITGGTDGLAVAKPELFGFVFSSKTSYYYLVIVFTILATIVAKNIIRSRVGRAFIAIRDNEKAAEVMGINLLSYKLLAFFLGCMYAGLAGSLTVHYSGFTSADFFPFFNSVWFLGMVIVGGQGSIVGGIFGAVALKLIDELVTAVGPMLSGILVPQTSAALGLVLRGLVIMLFLIFQPKGLVHGWESFKGYYRKWPFSLAKKQKVVTT